MRLHLVGHADNQPLLGALAGRYGDNRRAVARARRHTWPSTVQKALGLPPGVDLLRMGMGDGRAGREQRHRSRARAEPPRRGRGLVRRGEREAGREGGRRRRARSNRVKVCRVETVCKLRYKEGHAQARTHQEPGCAAALSTTRPLGVPAEFLQADPRRRWQISRDKQNVAVKFIGLHRQRRRSAGARSASTATTSACPRRAPARASLAVQDALEAAGRRGR
ncbi:MAG: hypothetical protein MZV70_41595 [Desulfobacterales bacterium]|nr:hypothetical protein [Desulfobacterales bacterium]